MEKSPEWKKVLANLWSRNKIAKKPHPGRGQESKWGIPDEALDMLKRLAVILLCGLGCWGLILVLEFYPMVFFLLIRGFGVVLFGWIFYWAFISIRQTCITIRHNISQRKESVNKIAAKSDQELLAMFPKEIRWSSTHSALYLRTLDAATTELQKRSIPIPKVHFASMQFKQTDT